MDACEPVWIHDPQALRGNWRSLMPECSELRVEVGCGKGKFTVETAAAEPNILLIAIEKVPDALVLAMESAMRMGLKNVFFVSLDADRIDEFFAHEAVVNKDAGQLIADGLCHERCGNGGVDAAGERQQRLAGADLFADRLNCILPVVGHRPVAVGAADAV